MGWGILESKRTSFPEGTSRVGLKDVNKAEPELETAKRKGGVVLSPQPSDDPNDPLNWTLTWKCLHLLILAFGSALTNACTVMLTPGLGLLTEQVESNDADVSTWILTAPTFWTSAAAFVVVAGTDVWGRRSFYVWSVFFLALANFAGFFSQNFAMLVVARTATGLLSAPLFTLLTATISDIFFVHQRGKSIGCWNLFLNSGQQVGQVIAGLITDAFGVSANFLVTGLIFSALVPLYYFTIFESAYFNRSTEDITSINVRPNKLTSEWDDDDFKKASQPPKQTYRRRLALSNGRLSDKSFFKGILKPLGLITSPIVLYSCILNSMVFLLLAGLPTFLSILLSMPPYELSPTELGLTNLPIFVVGLFTGPLTGWASDAVVGLMARHNSPKGVAEPEFRLVLLLISTPIVMAGMIGLGASIKDNLPLAWVLVWMTVTNVGAVGGVQIAIAYVIDCHPQHSAHAFTSVNMISAGAITVLLGPMINWLDASGPMEVFVWLASAAALASALALPIYVFGKRMRAWWQATWAQRLLD